MSRAAISPAAPAERIASLDVLRAVSLFVALFANLVTAFRQSMFEAFLPGRAPGGLEDAALFAVAAKGHVLFATLFGVGLAAQHARLCARGEPFFALLARRLGALFAIGVVHMVLLWDGDVLVLYAVTGCLVAPLLGRSARTLAAVGVALLLLQAAPLPYPTPFVSLDAMRLHVEAARRAYGAGTFREVVAFRVHELPEVAAVLLWTLPRTAGLFALGAAALRAGAFVKGHAPPWIFAIPAGVGLVIAARHPSSSGFVASTIDVAAPVVLAIGYGAAVLAAFETKGGRALLRHLAPLGRMVLTGYLAQSVVFGFVFYGYGLGLFGRMGDVATVLLGLGVYAAEAVLAAVWLRRFRFGPVEWIWRSFTYGAWQPMTAAAPA